MSRGRFLTVLAAGWLAVAGASGIANAATADNVPYALGQVPGALAYLYIAAAVFRRQAWSALAIAVIVINAVIHSGYRAVHDGSVSNLVAAVAIAFAAGALVARHFERLERRLAAVRSWKTQEPSL